VTDGLTDTSVTSGVSTPVAEAGIVGMAIGMAMNGMRRWWRCSSTPSPTPHSSRSSATAAKMANRTRGRLRVPMVIRIPYAGGIGGVEHHCDSSEAYYAHTPGLTVLAPATNATRTGCSGPPSRAPTRWCSGAKKHYFTKEEVDLTVPVPPIGSRRRTPAGRDATLIAYGPSVATALAAAQQGARRGPGHRRGGRRSLVPFDDETVAAAVRATGRAVVVAEAPGFASVASEIAARVTERCFHHLEAPVRRVTVSTSPTRRRNWSSTTCPGWIGSWTRWTSCSGTRHEQAGVHPPDLGEGLTEAELVRWLVAVGDTVAVDAPVAEVETAKAVVEVPSPFAGVIASCTAPRGPPWRWAPR